MLNVTILFVFILGLIIGSFLNVVILRYNTGRGIGGRSACFSCNKKLVWYELFPVLSFLVLGGRCRTCRSKISWQYPAVEFATGALFALVYWALSPLGWLVTIFYFVMTSLLVIITVYDLRHKIIPDFFVFLFILLGLIQPFVLPGPISSNFIAALLGGLITALPLFVLWVVSSGRWIGFGDVKLALGIGLFLGVRAGLSSLMLAFWLGAIIGLALIGLSKLSKKRKGGYNMKSEVPFAPFLIISFLITLLFNFDVINVFFF